MLNSSKSKSSVKKRALPRKVAQKSVTKKLTAKKSSSKRKVAQKKPQVLPGTKLSEFFNTAKKQTKDLVGKAYKKSTAAKLSEQNNAKKHKLAQETLKKHENNHNMKPSKSIASRVTSAKSKVQQASVAFTKSQALSKKAQNDLSTYQNHLNKINHLHKLVNDEDRKWEQSNIKNN